MTCRDFRQDLALAAAGSLGAERVSEVREHCAGCATCAAQLEQFQTVASAHSTAAVEVRDLALRQRSLVPSGGVGVASSVGVSLNPLWRWLLPLGAVAAVVVSLLPRERAVNPVLPGPDATGPVTVANRPAPVAPTLAVYRRAVERQGDASLEALLAKDADRLLRGTPRLDRQRLLDESF